MPTPEEQARHDVDALIKEHGLEVVLRSVLASVRPTLSLDHPRTMRMLDDALDHYTRRLTVDTLTR